MLGLGKPKVIAEHEAEGEIERVYHEIRQVLRVTGVNLNFRTWAGCGEFLPVMWDALRPNLETRAFESAADEVRAKAVAAAASLGRLDAASEVVLGESQRRQVQAALDLYHYVNPKLLVLTSAVLLSLRGEKIGQRGASGPNAELIERGAPGTMYWMELEAEDPDDAGLRHLFQEIKKTLSLSSINSDYRTLALWPEYLQAVWGRLKPLVGSEPYCRASDELREAGRRLARALPCETPLSRDRLEDLGQDVDAVVKTTAKFEELLPPLILNIALMGLDWKPAESLRKSPFPADVRRPARAA